MQLRPRPIQPLRPNCPSHAPGVVAPIIHSPESCHFLFSFSALSPASPPLYYAAFQRSSSSPPSSPPAHLPPLRDTSRSTKQRSRRTRPRELGRGMSAHTTTWHWRQGWRRCRLRCSVCLGRAWWGGGRARDVSRDVRRKSGGELGEGCILDHGWRGRWDRLLPGMREEGLYECVCPLTTVGG